jgi:hypothetical protein
VLDSIEWDVALLQEVPPGWVASLGRATSSNAWFVPTSRNWMRPLTGPVWLRRPHLAGSWEGGGNMVLVRSGRSLTVSGTTTWTMTFRPERRVVQQVRLAGGPDLYNLHASTGPERAGRDVLAAAGFAVAHSGNRPFLFGGDLNCRPAGGGPYPTLERRFGIASPPSGMAGSIDQILARGAEALEPVRPLAPELREVPDRRSGLLVRLSDHAPVVGRFGC